MYDNTARMHDPVLMHFATPDPLYAKYQDLSPWSHCAANPLNIIDPSGMKFTAAMSECVTSLRNEMTTISENGFVSGTKEEDYSAFMSELSEMEKSDQLFDVQTWDCNGVGATMYNLKNNAVVFLFPKVGNSLALMAHEFTHGFQFLSERLDLSIFDIRKDGYVQRHKIVLQHNLQTEKEAYFRGYMFGGDFFSEEDIKARNYIFAKELKFGGELSDCKKLEDFLNKPDVDTLFKQLSWLANCAFKQNGKVYTPLSVCEKD